MRLTLLPLFPVPFVAMGYLFLRAGRDDVRLSLSSRKWPAVRGTVQSMTRVQVGIHCTGGGTPRQQFYVRYFFDHDGKRHWGAWKSPPARTIERARIKSAVKEGGPITVFYCPEEPQRSVVDKGLTIERLQLSVTGVIFIVVPILLTILAICAIRYQ